MPVAHAPLVAALIAVLAPVAAQVPRLLGSYVAFLRRDSRFAEGASAASLTPLDVLRGHLLQNTIVYFLLFAALHAVAPAILRRVFSCGRGFDAQDDRVKETARSYLFSLAHHFLAVRLAVVAVSQDMREGVVAAGDFANVIPLALGYLSSDLLLVLLPEWLRGHGAGYLFHHGLGLVITFAALVSPLRLMRFAPHMTLCELSNFLLAALYACEKGGVPPTALYHVAMQVAFVAVFFLTRVVNLSLVIAALVFAHPEDWSSVGLAGQTASLLILGLQFFWMGKIINKLARNLGGPGKKVVEEKTTEQAPTPALTRATAALVGESKSPAPRAAARRGSVSRR
jgi:hypothetical protein